ncbi:MAG: YggS family pyridoxal phosphate-dependent enzyme [Candidatus Margulisbacteria bacterium]|nr:YggS family pyridoxal phosphate-dependent enzyme [Candidatus Margulisiibacteriota bacterium]
MISNNFCAIRSVVYPVQLGVVSKAASIEATESVIQAGATVLCESRVQDAEIKIKTLRVYPVSWHMIGHLQSNKIKRAVKLFDCLQSVDSEALLEKINSESLAIGKVMPILFQINIAQDSRKHGFDRGVFEQFISKYSNTFLNIEIRGIMAIIPSEDDDLVKMRYFQEIHAIFQQMKRRFPSVDTLSMGMSEDYKMAISCGANFVRIGSLIFEGDDK